ncbi:MAG: FABP family protein [Actinobacteria bacterium]|nr:FABP family protein [Actinomycetota bacterium]
MTSEIHYDVNPIAWLLGTWVGLGVVHFPGMQGSVQAAHELTVVTDGQPFLTHLSRIWQVDEAGNRVQLLTTESGIWRPLPNLEVEFTLDPDGNARTWIGEVKVTGLVDATITRAHTIMNRTGLPTSDENGLVGQDIRTYGLDPSGRLGWVHEVETAQVPLTSQASFLLTKAG